VCSFAVTAIKTPPKHAMTKTPLMETVVPLLARSSLTGYAKTFPRHVIYVETQTLSPLTSNVTMGTYFSQMGVHRHARLRVGGLVWVCLLTVLLTVGTE